MGFFSSRQEKTEVGERTWVVWKLDTLPGRCWPALAPLKVASDLGACSRVSGLGPLHSAPCRSAPREHSKSLLKKLKVFRESSAPGMRLPSWPGYTELRFCP